MHYQAILSGGETGKIIVVDHLASISPEEVLSLLTSLNGECKQLTKHTRYAYLKALFNFIRNNLDAQLQNPCDTPMLKKLFRPGKLVHWQVQEKETIDEVIFRTTKVRSRLMLELMARGGMRVGEVLKLTGGDVEDQKLVIRNPKSGKETEIVSKVILRHANLSTTQRYLGKASDVEAVRWIENLYG